MPDVRDRRNEGFYFVVVDGVPQYCQWQELKDYLRDSAKVRPGHTNVVKVNEDGTRVGFCPLPNKSEANRAFEYLVAEGWRGLDIRVSLVWKADLKSEEVERRRGPEQSRRRKFVKPEDTWQRADDVRHTTLTPFLPHSEYVLTENDRLVTHGRYCSSSRPSRLYGSPFGHTRSSRTQRPFLSTYFGNHVQSMKTLEPSCYAPYESRARLHPSQAIAGSMLTQYPQSTDQSNYVSKWPIDSAYVSYDPSSTSDTHVHNDDCVENDENEENNRYFRIQMSGFSYDTKQEELKTIVEQYGLVREAEMYRTKDHGMIFVTQVSSYRDISEILQELDGMDIRGSILDVRSARSGVDTTRFDLNAPSGEPNSDDSSKIQRSSSPTISTYGMGPLIVNGARGSRYYRRTRDDDSESTGDSSSSDDDCSQPPDRSVLPSGKSR